MNKIDNSFQKSFFSSTDINQDSSSGKTLNYITHIALKIMAAQFKLRPSLKKYMKSKDGWINFSLGITTATGSVEQAIIFHNGDVTVSKKIPENVDVVLRALDHETIKEMARITPNEMLNLIMKNRLVLDGNLAYLQVFNFYLSLLMGKKHQRMLNKAHKKDIEERKKEYSVSTTGLAESLKERKKYRIKGKPGIDKNVKYLNDPYLSEYSIDDFPRLQEFLDAHFSKKPEVCPERPQILTEWFRENGWEKDKNGKPWLPELRNGLAFKNLMEKKKPVIRKNDLVAGTTSSKEVGVTVFPDGQGTMFWGELNSVEQRILNPYICTKETADILHYEVLPYWADKTFREYCRINYNYPLCQRIDERWVAYYVWKSTGISHTIPNFKRLVEKGIEAIIEDAQKQADDTSKTEEQLDTLKGIIASMEGTIAYSKNLSAEAKRLAEAESEPVRKSELKKLSDICAKVPAKPAETLEEAVNSIWITWVALHMENSNTGFSIGRLDQWLQPFFEKDMEKLKTEEEKKAYIKHTLDLLGCYFMRMTDHVPMLPDIANYLFGGASSTQAITLGGVTEEGIDAVNDMTYLFLKVTEMLAIRDVNVNARFNPDKNSDQYLKRLCEVNIITSATPIMHNDNAVFKSLQQHKYSQSIINDWAATGCVEPTLQGRHFSHTASILLNMVASMELALNNGYHPVMRWDPGPRTGSIENGDFKTFDEFFNAWATQQKFIIDQAVELNNILGKAHQAIRPTPLLSALIDGCIETGTDVLKGGAEYNSSGTSNIGLSDVTDSLLAIKKLVFEENKVTFQEFKKAIDTNFKNHPALHAMVQNKVALFGSGDSQAIEMANKIAKVVHDCYLASEHYRGGIYAAGFWSMSQHVAYGSLSGTLPSGRLAGKAFTAGLTPSPHASKSFLDNISAVASLDPINLDNNIAFNVKLTPGMHDTREQTVDNMFAYVKSYFDQGGMQMQFNVVSSETLKDAMANPENYRNLMVRISGYNAYFVELNRDIQKELIERTEYGL